MSLHGDGDDDHQEIVLLRLMRTIAETVGEEPTTLPPLSQHTDPQALATLVTETDSIEITFTAYGCDITIEDGGSVRVSERE